MQGDRKKSENGVKGRSHLTRSEIKRFRDNVYGFYDRNKRDLPWRKTEDPYHILVSEIMLQQTQVGRVIEKYDLFIKAFPDIGALHRAELADVLRIWQGLGYNRRALYLKQAAKIIVEEHEGKIPDAVDGLTTLPGVGLNTASAICAYAYNMPVVYIETNIRSVFIHTFFPNMENIPDSDIIPLVDETLDRTNPRDWYSALMDYGVMLKSTHVNPGRRSGHYTRQSSFEGSDRQIRGGIVRLLTNEGKMTVNEIISRLDTNLLRTEKILLSLVNEGLISERDGEYTISR